MTLQEWLSNVTIFFFKKKKALYPSPSLHLGLSHRPCAAGYTVAKPDCELTIGLFQPTFFHPACPWGLRLFLIHVPAPSMWLGTSDLAALGSFSSLANWDKNSSSLQGFVILKTNTHTLGTSLVVQWLRPCIPNAGGLCLILGQGTRSHMLQLSVWTPQLKILNATTEGSTCHSEG